MPAAIEKDKCHWGAIGDESLEFLNGARPQRTLPLFTTFAADFQESLSGFHERTASMPSDDRWIQEQSFKHSRISFLNGKVRPVSWIYLWGVQRERAVDSSGLARWAPHFSGEHISHKMCSSTFYAGKPHVQFERRTVASVRATLMRHLRPDTCEVG